MKTKVWTLLGLLLIMIVALSAANAVDAVEVIATITLGNPGGYYGIAYDSKGEIFVANGDFDLVSVISDSTNTVVATIPVGSVPYGVAYDSGKGEIFVANHGADSVSVISDSTNTVIANVTLENQPQGIAYDSGKREIFVTYSESNRISVISDSSSTSVSPSPTPTPPTTSPSPTMPEFTPVAVLILAAATCLFAVTVKKGSSTNNQKPFAKANFRWLYFCPWRGICGSKLKDAC